MVMSRAVVAQHRKRDISEFVERVRNATRRKEAHTWILTMCSVRGRSGGPEAQCLWVMRSKHSERGTPDVRECALCIERVRSCTKKMTTSLRHGVPSFVLALTDSALCAFVSS